MFIQKSIIPKLLHGIETATYKIMLQSQSMPYFVRNDHLHNFPKQAIGHDRFPGKFIVRTTLGKIPLLHQIPNATEYSDMTGHDLPGSGVNCRWPISIPHRRRFPRNKRITGIIFRKIRIFLRSRGQLSANRIFKPDPFKRLLPSVHRFYKIGHPTGRCFTIHVKNNRLLGFHQFSP